VGGTSKLGLEIGKKIVEGVYPLAMIEERLRHEQARILIRHWRCYPAALIERGFAW